MNCLSQHVRSVRSHKGCDLQAIKDGIETRGRVRFDPGRLADALAGLGDAVVRPAPGVAFTAEGPSYNVLQERENAPLDRLRNRLEQALDPRGVLR